MFDIKLKKCTPAIFEIKFCTNTTIGQSNKNQSKESCFRVPALNAGLFWSTECWLQVLNGKDTAGPSGTQGNDESFSESKTCVLL